MIFLFWLVTFVSSSFVDCVSIRTINTGFIRVKIEFSHQVHNYNSNVTNIDRVAKEKTTLRFCLTQNTQLEHFYVTSGEEQSSWSGEIFIKRKFHESNKEEDRAIYCETECTGLTGPKGVTKSVSFNSEIENAAICPFHSQGLSKVYSP